MRPGDDMVMRLRLRHEPTQRERAAEERRTRKEGDKHRRAKRRLRRARAAREGNRSRRPLNGKRRNKSALARKIAAAKTTAKLSSWRLRALPVIGWVMLANDAALLFHEYGRRTSEGMSSRLVQVQDDQHVYGDLLPRSEANAAALEFASSDPEILRMMGSDNRMSTALKENVAIIRRLAYDRARGADLIRADARFDSADSVLDKFIMQSERAELRATADRVLRLIRERRAR